MKAIIFDASTLISMAMNGLLNELRGLKNIFDGKFIITKQVKSEIIDRPVKIKRFELEALRLKQLFDERILELPASLGLQINEKDILSKSQEFLSIANTAFSKGDRDIKLIDMGETSCLALSDILNKKEIQNVIAVDERTMRIVVEKPENLTKLLEKKLHSRVTLEKSNLKSFEGFKLIRSAELIYVAYKNKLTELKDPQVLDAMLYALKFKGCAISGEEIEQIKRLV